MEFGERLKHQRETKELTREALANKLNISYSAISKYETNVRFPDKETLCRLADFFDVSIDYLLGRTDINYSFIRDEKRSYAAKANHVLDASGLAAEDIRKVEEYIALLKQKYNADGTLKKI